jgi:hypothetical protein
MLTQILDQTYGLFRMPITDEQRKTLLALACTVARADNVVRSEEREYLRGFYQRYAGSSLTPETFDSWLANGPPSVDIEELPASIAQLFLYEAMQLAEVDGELADSEIEMVEWIMEKVSGRRENDSGKPEPASSALGRIQTVRKSRTRGERR